MRQSTQPGQTNRTTGRMEWYVEEGVGKIRMKNNQKRRIRMSEDTRRERSTDEKISKMEFHSIACFYQVGLL